MKTSSFVLLLMLLATACEPDGTNGSDTPPKDLETEPKPVKISVPTPVFDSDSAYAYIEKQLGFGPRVPNSISHRSCGDWLVKEFEKYGAKVIEQKGKVKGWDIQQNPLELDLRNIIASYNPSSPRRVLISAHWDTRPFSDQDDNKALLMQPIPGANDGASGVAILLEMARQIQKTQPQIGVDLVLWDAEDHGVSEIENSYCLGSQYWVRKKHKPGYQMLYGVNLDMVGAKNAVFRPEGFSQQYAAHIVDKVWRIGAQLGYQKFFSNIPGVPITDDHLYLLQAGLPCIDIIDQPTGSQRTFFGQWHTHQDDIHVISKETLKAVGQTMLELVYRER